MIKWEPGNRHTNLCHCSGWSGSCDQQEGWHCPHLYLIADQAEGPYPMPLYATAVQPFIVRKSFLKRVLGQSHTTHVRARYTLGPCDEWCAPLFTRSLSHLQDNTIHPSAHVTLESKSRLRRRNEAFIIFTLFLDVGGDFFQCLFIATVLFFFFFPICLLPRISENWGVP